MVNSYAVLCEYHYDENSIVEFPEGKSWEDVETHDIKCGTLFVQFKGEPEMKEFSLSSDYDIDYKRPEDYSIRKVDGKGVIIWDVDLSKGDENGN